jgi:hypothetical protein
MSTSLLPHWTSRDAEDRITDMADVESWMCEADRIKSARIKLDKARGVCPQVALSELGTRIGQGAAPASIQRDERSITNSMVDRNSLLVRGVGTQLLFDVNWVGRETSHK